MIAIGGGGFIPARIIRTFLKVSDTPDGKPRNIPIQAIGLSLYEALPDTSEEVIGKEVIRTQWLDFSTLGDKYGKYGGLLGKRILVVDEVDDRWVAVFGVNDISVLLTDSSALALILSTAELPSRTLFRNYKSTSRSNCRSSRSRRRRGAGSGMLPSLVSLWFTISEYDFRLVANCKSLMTGGFNCETDAMLRQLRTVTG